MSETLLVIDDDRSIRELLCLHFEEKGLRVLCAASAEEGERVAAEQRPDAIVLDVRLPDRSGLEALESLRARIDAPIVMVTALRDMDTTILAMKRGAFDFLPKPLDIGVLEQTLSRALSHRRVAASAPPLQLGPPDAALGQLIGESQKMRAIFKEVGRVAASKANVLISGESGTGKELLARVVHQYSDPSRPFVPVNCAAIVETLLESELFGHERGAFTGAVATKTGKCELAEDGTLFLDEIGDLSPNLQGKLLRVLQEREFERVGGVKRLPLRARVIAATHRDLAREVEEGRFREDLYQRLKVVTLELPPLRERPEDIPLLVEHLLSRINVRLGKRVTKVPGELIRLLQSRSWVGNVRELENALTRAVVLAPGEVLGPELFAPDADSLPSPTRRPGAEALLTLEELERAHIVRVLAHTRGHRGQACDVLGISRPTLIRKLKRYRLDGPSH